MPPTCWPPARRRAHERDRAHPQYRRLCAHGGWAGEGVGPRQVHGRPDPAGDAGGTHLSQPLCACGDPRRRHLGSGEGAGRDGDRHGCRLRQDVRRAADRAQRASARPRQGALQGRAGGGGGGHRRGDRREGRPPHQDEGARAAGLFHGRCRAGTRRRAAAREEARQPRARRAVRAGQRGGRLRRGRRWCARPPTIAPRCARTRWRCTRRSPTTTRCATASRCTPPPRCPTTCT